MPNNEYVLTYFCENPELAKYAIWNNLIQALGDAERFHADTPRSAKKEAEIRISHLQASALSLQEVFIPIALYYGEEEIKNYRNDQSKHHYPPYFLHDHEKAVN